MARAQPASFDVVSLRFALAYIDWDHVFPRIGAMVRPGGRVGVLTNTTASVPQFYKLFDQYRGSFDAAWKLFKHFREVLRRGLEDLLAAAGHLRRRRFISVPDSAETMAERLAAGRPSRHGHLDRPHPPLVQVRRGGRGLDGGVRLRHPPLAAAREPRHPCASWRRCSRRAWRASASGRASPSTS